MFNSFEAVSPDIYNSTFTSFHPFHQASTFEQLHYTSQNTRTQFSSPFSIRSILSRSSNSQLDENSKFDCAVLEQNNSENLAAAFTYAPVFYTGDTRGKTSAEVVDPSTRLYSSINGPRWSVSKEANQKDENDKKTIKKNTKRTRTIFTPTQLQRLEKEFAGQQYVAGEERKELAAELRLTETQVKVWFQNRRIRYRKHNQRVLTSSDISQLKTEPLPATDQRENSPY